MLRRVSLSMVIAVLVAVLAAPAYGRDALSYTSPPLEWGASIAWMDADGDGKADYCRVLISSPRAACTLATGTGFGATITSDTLDIGYPDGRGSA
jgi:hypothetical protein